MLMFLLARLPMIPDAKCMLGYAVNEYQKLVRESYLNSAEAEGNKTLEVRGKQSRLEKILSEHSEIEDFEKAIQLYELIAF
jgi:hypothetical protein